MREIDLLELDNTRKTGFRPGVTCCLVNNKKLLLVYKNEYGLWLLPQGGIENNETVEDAIKREITTELGPLVYESCEKNYQYIGEGDIEFSAGSKAIKEMHTDDGTTVDMKGKKYFFYAIPVVNIDINTSAMDYDSFSWGDYDQAYFLLSKNYQVKKRDLTINALTQLKNLSLIQ